MPASPSPIDSPDPPPRARLAEALAAVSEAGSNPLLPVSLLAGFLSALALAILTVALAGPPGRLWPAERIALGAATPDHPAASGPNAPGTPEGPPPASLGPQGPDIALIAKGPHGPLPIIAADGRRPREVYARPFDRDDPRPRIAILVTGLGLSDAASERAIATLPAEVSLAFLAYGGGLGEWAEMARADGHEVLLALPLEPFDYPENDPGPYALLTALTPPETAKRLDWLLSRMTGYAGLSHVMGGQFLGDRAALTPLFADAAARGLMFADASALTASLAKPVGEGQGLPVATADLVIDGQPTRAAIDDRLAELERLARSRGQAFGAAGPLPVSCERIALWARGLAAKGIVLAPVTAMTENGGAPPPASAAQHDPPEHALPAH